MEELQTNKWIRLVLALVVAGLPALAAVHWSDLVDKQTALWIVSVIGVIEAAIAGIAPGPGVPVTPLRGTGLKGLVFTHKADTRTST